MGIKCKQAGCPFEYEHCCIECEELEHCTSSCNLKPNSCGNSEMNGETSLQVFENANIEIINSIAQISIAKKTDRRTRKNNERKTT